MTHREVFVHRWHCMNASPVTLRADILLYTRGKSAVAKSVLSVRISLVRNDSQDVRLGRLGCYTTLTEINGATIFERSSGRVEVKV